MGVAVSPESTVFEGQVRGLGDLCMEGSSLSGHAVGRGCLRDPAAQPKPSFSHYCLVALGKAVKPF